jgi:Spy/CpxP family protein refolding chaperone
MTHIRSQFLAATLVGMAFVAPLQAQGAGGAPGPRPRDGQGAPMGGPRGGRPDDLQRGRGNPASMLLRMRSQLELTEDQVKKLEAMQNSAAPRANDADQLRARADLLEATQGDGNLSKARAALDRMSALRNERMIAGLKQRQEVRGILTATQKTKLDNWQQQRRGQMRQQLRGRGQQRGGMRSGPRGLRGPNTQGRMQGPGGQFGPNGRRGESGPDMSQPPELR